MPFAVQKVGVWPIREGGSSKETVRTADADERRSVPAPSTQQARRQATDRPSTPLLMTLEFQERATAIMPMATHEAIPPHRCRRRRLEQGRC